LIIYIHDVIFLCATLYSKDMIFNCVSISLHLKKNNKFTLHLLCYLLLFLKFDGCSILYPFFYFLFSYFLLFYKLDLNFGDFHLLDVIVNTLLKNSAFIRSLNMHLYQSNINLNIDIPYSQPLLYLSSSHWPTFLAHKQMWKDI